MADAMKDQVAIVGIGETPFAKRLEPTELELACQAVKAALEDAGVSPHEVDALGSYTMEETQEFELARNLGFGDIAFFSQVGYGGGAGCAAVGHVAMAIAGGVANVGVVWRARKRGDPSKPPARASPTTGSGRGLPACCAPWTKWPCSRGATCTSTARRGNTWPTWS